MKVIENDERISILKKLKNLREIESIKLLETNEEFYISKNVDSDKFIKVTYDSIWVTLKIGKNTMRVPNVGGVYGLAEVVKCTAKILLWRNEYGLEDSDC